ncbi:hypothetical protein L6164_024715 [Bauhinia variegata]|uniref:Uncharacterized protein n=1 Tax=Bauhinia variegata TaxID=167791 RepID=A0ACB9LZ78_BAUVA|nr:hypothetical protein L6164_024715 [Bauhinia variegata]
MSWIGDKRQTLSSNDKNKVEEEAAEEDEKMENNIGVTTHVYIKAAHTDRSRSLDKEVVLRRIRQRRRSHKVQAAFQSLIISPFSSTATATATASSNTHKRWIDDAFAAL